MSFQISFDPEELGRIETGWWRAHHERDQERMHLLLINLHVLLYGLSKDYAKKTLQSLFKGVKYHDLKKWKGAEQAVTAYYTSLKERSGLSFDPCQVAKLEVSWWRLHDELEGNPDKSPLAALMVRLYATIFGVNAHKLKRAGQLRAQATYEHDLAENHHTLPKEAEKHWQRAEALLIDFYAELKQTILAGSGYKL